MKGSIGSSLKKTLKMLVSMVPDNTNEEPWLVVCNNPAVNARSLRCSGNGVSTTKYSAVSFLPKALFEQFLRVANLYFVVVSAVACTPVSPIAPAPQIGPLLLVVAFSLMREAAEDRSRARADRNLNTRLVDVLLAEDRAWARTEWRSVAVGNLVRVRNGEVFPADLLLLDTSDACGVCYVSTANLDGETNLKLRRPCSWEHEPELLNSAAVAAGLQMRVLCDPPNSSRGAFSGKLLFPDGVPGPVAASTEQLLLRGCSLRNTDCIVGVVIFAGWQTKVMMNVSPCRPFKRSSLEGRLDRLILLLFVLLLLLCAGAGIGYGYNVDPEAVYLRGTDTNLEEYLGRMDDFHHRSVAVVLSIFTFFTLLSPIIPISLYVVVDVVRFVHCTYFIVNDRRMYHKGSSTGVAAQASNLCEDLGRIEYILSDKTGTLTCNSMNFLKCSVAGVLYGCGSTEVEMARSRPRRGGEEGGVQGSCKEFSFKDSRLMSGAWRNEADPWACLHFFRCLAICHTVLPEGSMDPRSMTYKAASPDEVALVAAAKHFGFVFHHRNSAGIRVLEQHVEQVGVERDVEYTILNVLEFDSTRKRQSVVCRHPDGRLVLYCKGADNVIFARMAVVGNQHHAATWEHLEMFGADGLRTLCLAYRELGTQEYDCWNAMYLQAKAVGKVDHVADLLERNLFLLGCTAIEDKLQVGVPTCIRSLSAAGIKFWMLTGDKTETAINVAYACGLLTNNIRQLVVNSVTTGISKEGGLDKLVRTLLREALLETQSSPNDPIALVIDGECLACALEEGGRVLLLALALKCKAVVCSRVSPLQKALVTSLVRDGAGKMTLSIGDGANDVEMIQAAHIGVGINGPEGLQAVMASDFAIAQFHFLTDLLLIHGRWSYLRITKVISYFLYENLAFALTQFWFSLHTLFSAQQYYDNWYMSLYSVLFTTFPVIVVGVLDKDVGTSTSKKHPELYQAGICNASFTWKSLALWFISAFYHSLVLFYLPVAAGTSAQSAAGFMFGMWDISTLTYTCVITTVNLRLLMACGHFTIWHCISVIASILVWVIFAVVYGGVKSWYDTWNVSGVILIVLRTWYFWQCLLIVPAAALAFDFLVEVVQRSFYPFDYQILQEHVKLPLVVAADKKAALYRKCPENSKSVASERRNSFEMRKSDVAQKRKVSIEFVRRSNNLEQGVDMHMNISRQTVFPGQTGATQIQSSTSSMVAAVNGMTEQHNQPSNLGHEVLLGSYKATQQADVWPPSNSMDVCSRDTRGPCLEIGASKSTQTIQQNYKVVLGAPNEVRQRVGSIQINSWVATSAPNQVWQQVLNNQQRDWAPSSSLNEVRQQADSCQPKCRAPRAPYGLWQRADSFQPDYPVSSSRPYEILEIGGTCQPDNWTAPSVASRLWQEAETCQPPLYGTSDGKSPIDVLSSEQDVNPLESTKSLEGLDRRKSKAVVVSSITKELQNNGSIYRIVSAIRTRTSLGTINKMGIEAGSSFSVFLNLKRSKSSETARSDINRKQVCIRKIALTGRKRRTGLSMFYTRGQENRSHKHVKTLKKNMKGTTLPVMSRRAQSNVRKILGQMLMRGHTGFAFHS